MSVPDPARFALHKLIVAGERPAAMRSKRDKDLAQAAQILEVLRSDRPGDLALAWQALAACGRSRVGRVEKPLPALERISAEAVESVRKLVGQAGTSGEWT